jgi:hypothetical protein
MSLNIKLAEIYHKALVLIFVSLQQRRLVVKRLLNAEKTNSRIDVPTARRWL